MAVVDVAALVAGSPIDEHVQRNTTSAYTAAQNFIVLPEKLSTDLTSLCESQDPTAVVTEMVIAPDGALVSDTIYRAVVRIKTKLAYHSAADWPDGRAAAPIAGRGERGSMSAIACALNS